MSNPYFGIGTRAYERQTPWTTDETLLSHFIGALGRCDPAPPFVEIASGSARVARAASRLRRGPWLAIDLEQRMLPAPASRLGAVVARGESLPLKTSSVGFVACWSGLHYIGAEAALSECARVLRADGIVVAAQKVADFLREDLAWYQDVQEARSTAPREWYFSEELMRIGESCGLRRQNFVRYRRWQRLRLGDWASRHGYFDDVTTKTLLVAAEAGYDEEFSRRTGFAVEGEEVVFPTDWALVTWSAK